MSLVSAQESEDIRDALVAIRVGSAGREKRAMLSALVWLGFVFLTLRPVGFTLAKDIHSWNQLADVGWIGCIIAGFIWGAAATSNVVGVFYSCSGCGSSVSSDTRRCPTCGTRLFKTRDRTEMITFVIYAASVGILALFACVHATYQLFVGGAAGLASCVGGSLWSCLWLGVSIYFNDRLDTRA